MNVLKSIVPVFLSAVMIVQSVPTFTAHGKTAADDLLETKVGDFTFRYIPDLPRKANVLLPRHQTAPISSQHRTTLPLKSPRSSEAIP